MRLQILTPEYDGYSGGIVTFYRHLGPVLKELGVDVHVLEGSAYHASDEYSSRVVDGVTVQTLERARLRSWWRRFGHFSGMPGLRRHMAAAWAMWEQANCGADADIVEASDWGLLFVPSVIEATRPLVVQCHGSVGQIGTHDPMLGEETENVAMRLLESAALSKALSIQTLSSSNAEFWNRECGREVEIIRPVWAGAPTEPNGVVPSTRGLVVGRLQKWKGPEIAVQALRRLGPRAPAIDWIGRDTSWDASRNSASSYLSRLYPDVWQAKFFHNPPVAPSEIAQRQARALFNLVPSTWDVFNFTAVEGMASGRPTIVSEGAGASELVEDGVNGFLFSSGDPEALAAAIEGVLAKSTAQLAAIGRAAQETVRNVLNPEAIARKRLAVYRSVIGNFGQGPRPPVESWLADICRPKNDRFDEAAFLENFPMQLLAKNLTKRVMRRLWR